ncbi:MAG: hypothetical protein AB7O65_10295 [Candidatus Korobacteraceae bacterium]
MNGYFHIFRTGFHEHPQGRSIPEYQVDYAGLGKLYSRTLEEPELVDFLREEAALDTAVLNRTLEALRSSGHVTIADIEMSESEIPALGFKQVPTEI